MIIRNTPKITTASIDFINTMFSMGLKKSLADMFRENIHQAQCFIPIKYVIAERHPDNPFEKKRTLVRGNDFDDICIAYTSDEEALWAFLKGPT